MRQPESTSRIGSSSFFYPAALLLLGLLLFVPGLGGRDLWAPVEPRYAEIARVMLEKGDWVIPRVNGELYTDKPILYFWLVLLFSKLAGAVSEWTVRLPSALSAIGLMLTTYLLGRDLLSPKTGFLAAIILGTSARVLWEGRWARTDMTFTLFFTLSLYFFSRALIQKGDGREFLIAYGLMGLATLTKGLIGIVLPGLICLSFVAVRGEWRSVLRWRILAGAAIFLLVTAPWFSWVAYATEGTWLKDFILIHHIQRYRSGLRHLEPFYYYFINFPLDFLPWTIFAVPAISAYRFSITRLKEPAPLFLLLWFFAVFLFFSLSGSKRALYLLPVFAPASLFVASYFDDLINRKSPETPLHRWSSLIFFSALGIAALAAPIAARIFQKEAFWTLLPFAPAVASGAFITVLAILRRHPFMVFYSTAGTVLVALLCAAVWVLPSIDRHKSPRPFAVLIKEKIPETAPLYIYASTMNDFNFYLKREIIPVLSSPDGIQKALAQAGPFYLIVSERDHRALGLERATPLLTRPVGGRTWHLVEIRR